MIHLLLINGWSANAAFWSEFASDLSNQFSFQVIDVDQSKTPDQWVQIIDRQVTENTLLMGWSLGGLLAIYYASISVKKNLGLITLQTNPCFIARREWPNAMMENEFQSLYQLVLNLDTNDSKLKFIRKFSHLLVQGSARHKVDRCHLKVLFTLNKLADRDALLSGLNLLRGLDVRKALTSVDIPCLHIFGQKDVLVPVELIDDLRQLVPEHQVVMNNEMAHLPCWSYRKEVISYLESFVKTL